MYELLLIGIEICKMYNWKKNIECLDREVDLDVERKFYLLKVYNY